MKVKKFEFPSFEEWLCNKEIKLWVGYYYVQFWAYGDIVIQLRVHDESGAKVLLAKYIKYYRNVWVDDLEEWYNKSTEEINEFWEKYVRETYLED